MTRGQALIGMVCSIAGCWSESRIDEQFTDEEWTFLLTEFQLPVPRTCPPRFTTPDECSRAVTLGRQLFFEPALSGPIAIDDPQAPGSPGERGTISCAGCHDPDRYFIDTRSKPNNVSIGAFRTKHNAMSVLNLGYKEAIATERCGDTPDDELCTRVFSWTGKYRTAGDVFRVAGPKAMNTAESGEEVSRAIRSKQVYLAEYQALFHGVPPVCTVVPATATTPETIDCPCPGVCHTTREVFDNIALVFDAYLRNLYSSHSPFDQYLATPVVDGKTTKPVEGFGDAEKRGLGIFIGKGMCIECHRGPLFSDLKFHNTGVPQIGPNVLPTDQGVGEEGLVDESIRLARIGEFLTPPLRHVEMTAPYMHAGQFATLHDVIEFYRGGGVASGFSGARDPRIEPLEITDDEASDLEAFLKSLTGQIDPFWQAPEPVPQ